MRCTRGQPPACHRRQPPSASISSLQAAQYGADFGTNDSVNVDYVALANSVKGGFAASCYRHLYRRHIMGLTGVKRPVMYAANQWLRERVRPTVKLYWTALEGAPEMLPPCPARSSAEQTRFALPYRHIGRVPQHAYSKPSDLPTKQV